MRAFSTIVLLVMSACWIAACATATNGTPVAQNEPQPIINELTAVAVEHGDGMTTVRLTGTAKPVYSVFRMSDPQRLIVDLEDCSLRDIPAVTEVNDGLLSVVTTNKFQDGEKAKARVMIGFEKDAEFTVEELDNTVALHMKHPAGFVAEIPAEAPVAEPEKAETVAVVQAAVKPACVAGEPIVLQAHQGDSSSAKLNGIAVEKTDNGVKLSLKASGRITDESVEVLQLCEPDRMVIDLFGVRNATKTRSLKGDGNYIDQIRLGAHKTKLRIVLDLNQPLPEFAMEQNKKRLVLSFAETAAQPVAVAAATEPKAEVKKPAPVAKKEEKVAEPVADATGFAQITGLNFKQHANESIIEIGLSEAVNYNLVESSEDQMVLELSGAQLPAQLEQSLDTSEFDSPVTMVSSYTGDADAKLVKVVVQTRSDSTNHVELNGNTLLWHFERENGLAQNGADKGRISIDATGETVIEYQPGEAAGLESAVVPMAEAAQSMESTQRISLELKNTDILDVLRLIADVSKLNIITSDDVSGTVTVRLLNVPWQQALDIILRSKGLGQERRGNIIRVAPLSVLQAEREMRIEQIKAQRELEPLSVRLIPVSYSQARELLEKVKDLLSPRGTVNFDERTNVLIVKDIDEVLSKSESLVSKLDLQTPQVMIEAKVVEADVTNDWGFGIQWGGYYQMGESSGNPTGLVFPSSVGMSGASDATVGPGEASPPNWIVNVPTTTTPTGALGMNFGSVDNTANLALRLSAYESSGKVKIISSPRISTLDNSEATIKQGLQIPIITLTLEGTPATKMINANLELNVTPHITADGSIIMDLKITKQEPDFSRTNSLGDPAIIEKTAETQVLVRTGETTVIGGIYTKSTAEASQSIPGLSKIPILGWLFKNKSKKIEKTELLIFITPRIINRSQSSLTVD